VVRAIAAKIPSIPSHLFDGLLGTVQVFNYQGQTYDLWAAQAGKGAQVKVAVVTNGTPVLVATLTAANFVANAQTNITSLISAANTLAGTASKIPLASTTKRQALPDKNTLQTFKTQTIAVNGLERAVEQDISNNTCKTLDGCFRADATLLTREGWRRVDEIRAGELVAARDEFNPDGAIEWKRVEAKFERSGRILELVVNAHEIGTTPEHPFFVKEKGWTEAGALHAGDEVRTQDGWAEIDEVRDTGLYEKVYNIRVADFHTYFVGGDGCAVWAHNANCVTVAPSAGTIAYDGQSFVVGIQPNKIKTLSTSLQLAIQQAAAKRTSLHNFAGNIMVVIADDSRGRNDVIVVQSTQSSAYGGVDGHSEALMVTQFNQLHVTHVIAAFSERSPCAGCVLQTLPVLSQVAPNPFTIYWAVQPGDDNSYTGTTSNARLQIWWGNTGLA